MAKRNRKARGEIKDPDNIDLLKPLDILSLGGEDDPCFGKYHDLKASECQECGDSEFCTIIKAQNLHKDRLSLEAKQRFKDIEEAKDITIKKESEAKKLIEKYMEKGLQRMKIVLKVSRETNLTKGKIKQLYDNI